MKFIHIFVLVLLIVVNQRVVSLEKCNIKNIKIVKAFYQGVFGDHNFDLINKYVAANFTQHNKDIADGPEALKTFAKGILTGPTSQINFRNIAADGDFVWLYTVDDASPLTVNVTTAFVDIFKLIDGKIIEHWDVAQRLPPGYKSKHPFF